jgi:hypothetical protein
MPDGPVLKAIVSVQKGSQGAAVRFALERPVVVSTAGKALVLEFPPAFEEARLTVRAGETEVTTASLDGGFAFHSAGGSTPGKATFAVPLERGVKFDGFSVSYPDAGEKGNPVLPASAGLGPAPRGVVLAPATIIDTRITGSKKIGNPREVFTFDVSEITADVSGIASIAVNYVYEQEADGECSVSITAEHTERKAEFNVRQR